MSMAEVLPAVQTLLTANFITPGTIDDIFQGRVDMQQKPLRSQVTFLAIEDGGETTVDDNSGHMQYKQYNVIVELAVKRLRSVDSLPQLLSLWDQIETVIYDPLNRILEDTDGSRLADNLAFFDVESGYLFGTNNVAWRWRSGIVPYRKLICRRSFP